MSIFKKTMVVIAAAAMFVFAGCKVTETEYLDVKVSQVNATIGGASFKQYAVAKVSDDAVSDSKVSQIFTTNGTIIYSKNSTTGEQLIITYGGKTAGTYKTGTASTDVVVDKMMNFLVTGNNSFNADDFVSAKANVTYIDKDNVKWFSTLCTINISGQTNGTTLSLINGSFNCDVYKSGDSSQKKSVSGTIHNVVGLQ